MRLDSDYWLNFGWLFLLAVSAGILLTALLRKSGRRWFGAEWAYRLWLLPPLALLGSAWPHAAAAPVLTRVVQAIVLPLQHRVGVIQAASFDWRGGMLMLWLVGALTSLLQAGLAQWRYQQHLRDATELTAKASSIRVLRARSDNVGPAMVGAFHRRIVIPSDFEQRYSSDEQALILAHEAIHAKRFDGVGCLLGRLLAGMFWFYPPAWWALAAFRQDQELACDAAVLREHRGQRRVYADAMLKTRPGLAALPAGCAWAPRHPLMERIAMLKATQPGTSRRRFGWMMLATVGAGFTAAVYAATPGTHARATTDAGNRYTLKADVSMGGNSKTLHFAQCVTRGESVEFAGANSPTLSWKGRFTVLPQANGELEIRAHVDTRFEGGHGSVREESGEPIVRTLPGQAATVVFGQVVKDANDLKLRDNTIKLILTPSPGCAVASTPSVAATTPAEARVDEYQLNTSVEISRNSAGRDTSKRASFAICTTSGKPAAVKIHDWLFDVTPARRQGDRLHVDVSVSDATHAALAHAGLDGAVYSILHADGVSADGRSRYTVEITPLPGCPARDKAVMAQTRA